MTLAFRLLTHDKPRLAASLGGITFAVLLMLMQMGFRNSLLDSASELLSVIDADIIVCHKAKRYVLDNERIPRQRVYQALSVEGVAAAYPLTFEVRSWKSLGTGLQRPVRLIGVDPADPLFLRSDLQEAIPVLASPDTGIIDVRSRSYLGPLGPGPAQVDRHELRIVRTFTLGTDLDAEGSLIVGEDTYYRITRAPRNWIEMVLVKTTPGADVASVVRALQSALPTDVIARSKSEFAEKDHRYWTEGTPISIVVGIGMAMGFIVGVGIAYQVLYTEVSDHLEEFATLKAMGYPNLYLVAAVLLEGIVIGFAGAVPAVLLGKGLYLALESLTGLLLRLTWPRVVLVLSLAIGMCTLAASLAVSRVLRADPADLFR